MPNFLTPLSLSLSLSWLPEMIEACSLMDGVFLVRPKQPTGYCLDVAYRGRVTHHALEPLTACTWQLNKRPLPAVLATIPDIIRKLADPPGGVVGWPVRLIRYVSRHTKDLHPYNEDGENSDPAPQDLDFNELDAPGSEHPKKGAEMGLGDDWLHGHVSRNMTYSLYFVWPTPFILSFCSYSAVLQILPQNVNSTF